MRNFKWNYYEKKSEKVNVEEIQHNENENEDE